MSDKTYDIVVDWLESDLVKIIRQSDHHIVVKEEVLGWLEDQGITMEILKSDVTQNVFLWYFRFKDFSDFLAFQMRWC